MAPLYRKPRAVHLKPCATAGKAFCFQIPGIGQGQAKSLKIRIDTPKFQVPAEHPFPILAERGAEYRGIQVHRCISVLECLFHRLGKDLAFEIE
jgi:hypothetical protein